MSARIAGGPSVDDVEDAVRGLWRHEAEYLLKQRMDNRVQPGVGESFEVVLGLPDIDISQSGVRAPGKVRDQAVRPVRAEALLDAGVGLGGDRYLVGEC